MPGVLTGADLAEVCADPSVVATKCGQHGATAKLGMGGSTGKTAAPQQG